MWQYHILHIAAWDDSVEPALKEAGLDGWEMVAAWPQPGHTTWTFVFKRPHPDTP
jgi:hypothetical protein